MPRRVDHMEKPPAPTEVTCLGVVQGQQISGGGGYQYHATMQWMDNATEEFNTCFRFVRTDGSPGTTQCSYADDYEGAPGLTGPTTIGLRQAVVIIPEGEFNCVGYVNNWHENGVSINSPDSAPPCSVIAAPPAETKPGKSQEKGNPNKP